MQPPADRPPTPAYAYFVLGVGPFAVGWFFNALAPRFGAESMRFALVIPLVLNGVGAFAYGQASKSYARELAAAR